MDARTRYTERKSVHAREVARCDARFRTIGTLRLLCVAAILGVLIAVVFAHAPAIYWSVAALAAFVFVGLVFLHATIDRARVRAAAGASYSEHGLERLGGNFSGSRKGETFLADNHPYAADLDLFGAASIFQRVSVAETRFGERVLASWLSVGAREIDVLEKRQAAAKELIALVDFREKLAVIGGSLGKAADAHSMLEWLEKKDPVASFEIWRWLVFVMPVLVLSPFFIAPHFAIPQSLAMVPYGLSVLLAVTMRARTAPILAAVASREASFAPYGELFAVIEESAFQSPLLVQTKDRFKQGDRSATGEMAKLASILSYADALSNEVFRLLVAPVFGFEPRAVLALESWRKRNQSRVRDWLDALGEVEALSSFATMAFEDTTLAWPEFTREVRFEAVAMGHPLLSSDKRVDNDVSFPAASHALVITGSNMSGKTTLMRAMGANTVLALAGAPVRAKTLKLGMLRMATSMRVSDSLVESTSRFYAELKKLKLVMDMAGEGEGVFFLLDEILHGTNSRERLIGARALVRELLKRGALGAVSTHDLGLADLESELPAQVKNVHFEEQVEGDVMTFDYKLRAGVVKSSNALRLMKIVGLTITDTSG